MGRTQRVTADETVLLRCSGRNTFVNHFPDFGCGSELPQLSVRVIVILGVHPVNNFVGFGSESKLSLLSAFLIVPKRGVEPLWHLSASRV